MKHFAKAIVLLMSFECLVVSIGFAVSHEWKLAMYWFLVSCINTTVYTF